MNTEIMELFIIVLERELAIGAELSLNHLMANMMTRHQEYLRFHELMLGNYLNILRPGQFEAVDEALIGPAPMIQIRRLR